MPIRKPNVLKQKWCWEARQISNTAFWRLKLCVGETTELHLRGAQLTMKSIKTIVRGPVVFIHNK